MSTVRNYAGALGVDPEWLCKERSDIEVAAKAAEITASKGVPKPKMPPSTVPTRIITEISPVVVADEAVLTHARVRAVVLAEIEKLVADFAERERRLGTAIELLEKQLEEFRKYVDHRNSTAGGNGTSDNRTEVDEHGCVIGSWNRSRRK